MRHGEKMQTHFNFALHRQTMFKHEKVIFPQKLWRLVNDQRVAAAIRWSEDGQSILLFEGPLSDMCLGKENHMFYTKQPKSFIRQLHLYGFRKVDKNQFVHQNFRRDRPDLIKLIKRTYNKSNQPLINNQRQINGSEEGTGSNSRGSGRSDGNKFDEEELTTNQQIAEQIVYDDAATVNWYEIDISYNYNEDNVLTLYNNDIYPDNCNSIYPDNCDDNNITL